MSEEVEVGGDVQIENHEEKEENEKNIQPLRIKIPKSKNSTERLSGAQTPIGVSTLKDAFQPLFSLFGMLPSGNIFKDLGTLADALEDEKKFAKSIFQYIFSIYDEDHSGEIDVEELETLLKDIGESTGDVGLIHITQNTLDKVLLDIDRDGNGTIDKEEFANYMVGWIEVDGSDTQSEYTSGTPVTPMTPMTPANHQNEEEERFDELIKAVNDKNKKIEEKEKKEKEKNDKPNVYEVKEVTNVEEVTPATPHSTKLGKSQEIGIESSEEEIKIESSEEEIRIENLTDVDTEEGKSSDNKALLNSDEIELLNSINTDDYENLGNSRSPKKMTMDSQELGEDEIYVETD